MMPNSLVTASRQDRGSPESQCVAKLSDTGLFPDSSWNSGDTGTAASERQRRSGSKPRVGATRLPWVIRPEPSQPQRGCDRNTMFGRNPVGVDRTYAMRTQGSLRQPWAGGQNAVGVHAESLSNLSPAPASYLVAAVPEPSVRQGTTSS